MAAVIHLCGLWGLSQLVVGSLSVVALARYRSLIPLLYLLASLGVMLWLPLRRRKG